MVPWHGDPASIAVAVPARYFADTPSRPCFLAHGHLGREWTMWTSCCARYGVHDWYYPAMPRRRYPLHVQSLSPRHGEVQGGVPRVWSAVDGWKRRYRPPSIRVPGSCRSPGHSNQSPTSPESLGQVIVACTVLHSRTWIRVYPGVQPCSGVQQDI